MGQKGPIKRLLILIFLDNYLVKNVNSVWLLHKKLKKLVLAYFFAIVVTKKYIKRFH